MAIVEAHWCLPAALSVRHFWSRERRERKGILSKSLWLSFENGHSECYLYIYRAIGGERKGWGRVLGCCNSCGLSGVIWGGQYCFPLLWSLNFVSLMEWWALLLLIFHYLCVCGCSLERKRERTGKITYFSCVCLEIGMERVKINKWKDQK